MWIVASLWLDLSSLVAVMSSIFSQASGPFVYSLWRSVYSNILPILKIRLICLLLLSCSIGEGNGNPLQCSCLENPRNGGAWWATLYGVAQSQTRLKRLSSSRSSSSSRLKSSPSLCGCLESEAKGRSSPNLRCFWKIKSISKWYRTNPEGREGRQLA